MQKDSPALILPDGCRPTVLSHRCRWRAEAQDGAALQEGTALKTSGNEFKLRDLWYNRKSISGRAFSSGWGESKEAVHEASLFLNNKFAVCGEWFQFKSILKTKNSITTNLIKNVKGLCHNGKTTIDRTL